MPVALGARQKGCELRLKPTPPINVASTDQQRLVNRGGRDFRLKVLRRGSHSSNKVTHQPSVTIVAVGPEFQAVEL